MDRKYNKGLNNKTITSLRKDKKRYVPKVKHKEASATNNDKISVNLINDIIDKPISKFIEKVNDTNIFYLGISFVKRLNLSFNSHKFKNFRKNIFIPHRT